MRGGYEQAGRAVCGIGREAGPWVQGPRKWQQDMVPCGVGRYRSGGAHGGRDVNAVDGGQRCE